MYPYAFTPKDPDSLHLGIRCGVKSIPFAVLVDPAGKVAFSGSPRDLTDELIERTLERAAKKPLWDQPKEFDKLRAALRKFDLSGAIREANELKGQGGDAAIIAKSLEAIPTAWIASNESFVEDENWLEAKISFEQLASALKGRPEEKFALERVAMIQRDPAKQEAIQAHIELRRLVRNWDGKDPTSPEEAERERSSFRAALQEIVRKHPGTFAAKRALTFLD